MGQIDIPGLVPPTVDNPQGLGRVNIKGTSPDDEEIQAILQMLQAAPSVLETQPIEVEPESEPEPKPTAQPREIAPSRTGLVPQKDREAVRKGVESMPGLLQFMTEMSPGAAGGAAGFLLTAGIPIPGARIAGTIAGTAIGEFIGQETGVSPQSDLNLALAAGGPVVGRVGGATFRGIERVVGGSLVKFPPIRAARAQATSREALGEVESFGSRVIAAQTGLGGRTADDLYEAVRRAGVKIQGARLKNSQTAIRELIEEMKPTSPFPETRQAIQVLKNLEQSLQGSVDFSTFVRARQLVGRAVSRFESGGGEKLGATKKAFAAMSRDLDELAKRQQIVGGPTGKFASRGRPARAAKLAQAAIKRAKLQFAVNDVEQLVSRFAKVDGDTLVLDAKGMLKAMTDITDPRNVKFDKNLVDALGKTADILKERLGVLAEIAKAGGPGGPGSLVVRGVGARIGRKIIGGTLGSATGGIGQGIGAVAGASLPEMIMGIFSSKPAFRIIEFAAKIGRGEVNARTWMFAGLVAARAVGDPEDVIEQKQIRPARRPTKRKEARATQ